MQKIFTNFRAQEHDLGSETNNDPSGSRENKN